MRVLLELRPALSGHAGIPQETRLLFRGLGRVEGLSIDGLLQSSNRILAAGLPPQQRGWPADRRINRLSRVVLSLHGSGRDSVVQRVISGLELAIKPAQMLLGSMLGRPLSMGRFEATHFRDFIWRSMFAKTLPPEDFDTVTSGSFRVLRLPWSALHATGLLTARLGVPVYPRLDTRGYEVMVAETPYPGRVMPGTSLVVRYHDAIPLLMPHTISNRSHHQGFHYHALKRNVADGAWFACVSDATRKDLLAVFPEVAERAVTIPNMVSHHYHEEDRPARLVPEIVGMRRSRLGNPDVRRHWADDGVDRPYLLMVSTLEPRKNHLGLLAAWEQLRIELQADLQLVLVGELGWEHEPILGRLRPWIERGCLHLLEDVPAAELRLLYRHAVATVCPSFGEGFDFSGVEAMRCGGVVAASAIAAHRDTYEDACEYFSPYASGQMVAALKGLIDPRSQERRQALQRRGAEVSARYLPERILPAWQDFLHRIRPA